MNFGERLVGLRKSNGYTNRKEFAEKIGIPHTTLRNYETGVREPGHSFLIQMSKEFGVTVDSLLGVQPDAQEIHDSWGFPLLTAYKAADTSTRHAACNVLRIDYVEPDAPLRVLETSKPPEEEETVRVFRAARTNPGAPASEPGYVEIPKSVLQRLKDAPQNEKI